MICPRLAWLAVQSTLESGRIWLIMQDRVEKTEAQWRQQLDPETYRIVRQQGTEPAFSGKYWDLKDSGTYLCTACGEALFSSQTKYDSGTGWPSFTAPAAADRVAERPDDSAGMRRTEVICARCDAHLGHVFPDGPAGSAEKPGLRYCINSASLKFAPEDEAAEQVGEAAKAAETAEARKSA